MLYKEICNQIITKGLEDRTIPQNETINYGDLKCYAVFIGTYEDDTEGERSIIFYITEADQDAVFFQGWLWRKLKEHPEIQKEGFKEITVHCSW